MSFSIFDSPEEEAAFELRHNLPRDERKACDRLEYHVPGSQLQYVEASIVLPVDGDLVQLSEVVAEYDRAIAEPQQGDGASRPLPEIDWTAKPEGDSFEVRFGRSPFSDVRWTCRAFFFKSSSMYDNQQLKKDLAELWSCKVGEAIDSSSRSLEEVYNDLLLAHVKAQVQAYSFMFRTPAAVDDAAAKFVNAVMVAVRDMRRAQFEPDMYALVSYAAEAARPTPTGIDSLDAILGGGLVPGIYVVAGDPGAGKTALVTQTLLFAAHSCNADERAVYVMLDQGGAPEIAKRLVSLSYAIHAAAGDAECLSADRCKLSTAAEWDDYERGFCPAYADKFTNGRAILLSLMDGSYHNMVSKLDSIVKRGEVSLRLVVVDYYQLLRDVGGSVYDDNTGETVGSSAEFASAVMRDLRTWATTNRVPVVLCGQFTKESIMRHAKGVEPVMTDLLGAVDVAYQSEAVVMLANGHDGTGIVTISDAKHRHAGNDAQADRTARLRLDGEHGFFTEVE